MSADWQIIFADALESRGFLRVGIFGRLCVAHQADAAVGPRFCAEQWQLGEVSAVDLLPLDIAEHLSQLDQASRELLSRE